VHRVKKLNYQSSYWERETFLQKADLAIIGSGIVGLSAALKARQLSPSARIVILERGPLPIGASTRNAGFACFGSITELLSDLQASEAEAVYELLSKRWQGLRKLRQRVGDVQLGFEQLGGYELFRQEEQGVFEQCMEIMPEINRRLEYLIGEKEVFTLADEDINRFGLGHTRHLIKSRVEGQLHTGRMMKSLLNLAERAGITIYNGVPITAIEETGSGVKLQTDYGWELSAGKVLVATNGFARQLLSGLEVKPARNQVLVTRPVQGLKLKGAFHYNQGFYYFRNIDGRILLGGGRNLALEAETTDQFGTSQNIKGALEHILHTVVAPDSEVEVDYWWSGILGVGTQKTPIVKPYSDHIAIAVRLGGMGVAIGSLVGEEGAELIMS